MSGCILHLLNPLQCLELTEAERRKRERVEIERNIAAGTEQVPGRDISADFVRD